MYTTQDLLKVAVHMAKALVEDVQGGTVPANLTTWSEIHDWVDANTYGIDATEELLVLDTPDDELSLWHAAEDIAFTVYLKTPELDTERAILKPGARVRLRSEPDKVLVVPNGVVSRVSHVDCALLVHVLPESTNVEEAVLSHRVRVLDLKLIV